MGPSGSERPVLQTGESTFVEIGSLTRDIDSAWLAADGLASMRRAIHPGADLPVVPLGALDHTRIAAPLANVGKIVCVGLNYRDHARETHADAPLEPILFLKGGHTIVGPNDGVVMPPHSKKTDYEVELAVVIGRAARYLGDHDDPRDYIAGYTISNDVSERHFQLERGGQWDKGKNCETFNPLGPCLVTTDEVPDPQVLELSLSVNGEVRQRSSTAEMIFDVAYLVRYISHFMPLLPGDIINTGTPAGVGSGFDPPRFLSDGDSVEVSISGLGRQTHTVSAHPAERSA